VRGVSRARDRIAARREARLRRAELRVLATARAFGAAVDSAAREPFDPTQGDDVVTARATLEAAALRYSELAPARRGRRRRRRR
jgi:hypothetical protein